MTKYAHHYSEEKQKSRDKIYNEVIAKKGRSLNVLTLPSTNFILERELVKIKGVNLTCVEKERSIYMGALNKSCTTEYYNNEVFEYLEYTDKVFDVIWLDLCCQLSLNVVRKFLYLIQSGKLSRDGVIALTVMATRENDANIIPHVFDCSTVEDFRRSGFPHLVSQHSAQYGRNVELKELYHYTSKPLPLNMNMYLFTSKNN